MKVFGATEGWTATSFFPGGLDTYLAALWIPGSGDPGMKAFEDAWMQKYKSLPNPNHTYYYNCFWTVIKAMELAGTDDPVKVAQALRSGNLELDSGWGHLRIPTNGTGEVSTIVAKILNGGKLVEVWPQDYSATATGTPPPTGGAIHTGLDINSPIGELVGNPNTAAILDKWIPGFSTDPGVVQAYNFTLPFIQPFSEGTITQEQVDGIAADLLAIK